MAAQVEARYAIDSEEFVNPWNAAFSSAISFILGAVLPMLAILLFPPEAKFVATFILTVVALGLAGYTSAWLSQAPRLRAVIRVIMGGAFSHADYRRCRSLGGIIVVGLALIELKPRPI